MYVCFAPGGGGIEMSERGRWCSVISGYQQERLRKIAILVRQDKKSYMDNNLVLCPFRCWDPHICVASGKAQTDFPMAHCADMVLGRKLLLWLFELLYNFLTRKQFSPYRMLTWELFPITYTVMHLLPVSWNRLKDAAVSKKPSNNSLLGCLGCSSNWYWLKSMHE